MAPRATSSEERIMKPNSLVLRMAGVLIIGLVAGCSAPRLVQISEPVGPAPIVLPSRDTGRLVVYTEEDSSTDEDNVSSSYKPYKVLDSSGRVLKEVSNDSGEEVVPLRAGRYFVRAEASGRRVIAIEVQIVVGRTTEIHLDGKWRPEAFDKQELVFGPDGTPVGYRSAPATAPADSERNP